MEGVNFGFIFWVLWLGGCLVRLGECDFVRKFVRFWCRFVWNSGSGGGIVCPEHVLVIKFASFWLEVYENHVRFKRWAIIFFWGGGGGYEASHQYLCPCPVFNLVCGSGNGEYGSWLVCFDHV